jgi:hypothetical protein
MNILPLILALVLMLSVLTVEKLEKVKNQTIVQKEYQAFLEMSERQVFNKRQEKLFDKSDKDIKQLSFRFFVDKKARDRDENITKQYRLLNLELMKVLYGEATFFKNLEQKRPNFLEELLTAIEQASEKAPKGSIKRIRDIARLDLDDSELQKAFYHMLKGTTTRKKMQEIMKDKDVYLNAKEKGYVSLFDFINYDGADATPTIDVQHAPREILKAVFISDDVVDAIIAKRQELAESGENGATDAFQNEFLDKRRPGLDDKLLNFKITKGDKKVYD